MCRKLFSIRDFFEIIAILVGGAWLAYIYFSFDKKYNDVLLRIAQLTEEEKSIDLDKKKTARIEINPKLEVKQIQEKKPQKLTNFRLKYRLEIKNNGDKTLAITENRIRYYIGTFKLSKFDIPKLFILNNPPIEKNSYDPNGQFIKSSKIILKHSKGIINWKRIYKKTYIKGKIKGGGTAKLDSGESSFLSNSFLVVANPESWIGITSHIDIDGGESKGNRAHIWNTRYLKDFVVNK